MIKNYLSRQLFVVLFLTACVALTAQPLNGVYTINNGQSTGGTNFASFTAFANAVTSNGVSGPVTVNVGGSGAYNEQINFTAISGVSASNSITINGNNYLLTFSSNSQTQPWTFGLGGGDFIYVHNLQIQANGSSYAHACHVFNGSNNNSFINCTFSVQPNTYGGNYQIPVVVSGGPYYYSSGTSGNNNTWDGCHMFGGYFGMTFYGNGSAPYATGNKVLNSRIEDFMYYGIYCYSQWNLSIVGNDISRPNRNTALYDFYGIQMQETTGTLIEGNDIHHPFAQQPTSYYSAYAITIYCYFNGSQPTGSSRNIIRNNIIRDMECDSYIYGIQLDHAMSDVYHNTVSFDHTASQGYDSYGMYSYDGMSTLESKFHNNIISITRGGYGYHYGFMIYYQGSAMGAIDYNDVYVNSSNGNNYTGYYNNTAYMSFANWQSSGWDVNGSGLDPAFANISNADLTPTNLSIDNMGTPLNLFLDFNKSLRNMTAPDAGAIEFNTPSCSGTPSITGIASPTYVLCPGENIMLGLLNYPTDKGLTYQWSSSTVSNVGPFTNTIGTTFTVAVPNVTVDTYYRLTMVCTLSGGGTAQAVSQVTVGGVTTNTAPYFEDFEGIGSDGRLPNCSWASPNMGAGAMTHASSQSGNRLPRSGNSFATFDYSNPTSYYYTNQIYLYPGITYSAALWYMTNFSGATNWSNLSILLGTSQSPSGLVTLASTNGAAVSPMYKPLSNTFTVATAGYYHVAVRASSGQSGGAPYLVWDDLSITIPCTSEMNAPNVTISTPNATVCSGTQVVLNASGADTYKWSNGSTSAANSLTPGVTSNYTVVGTSNLTGCSSTVTQMVFVKQAPNVSVSYFPLTGCVGKPVTLSAGGAVNYAWSTGATGGVITVTPSTAGVSGYTVIGTNQQNCNGSANIQLQVNPNPVVSMQGPSEICFGEAATFTASGGTDFEWFAGNGYVKANPATLSPMIGTTTYTVIGTDPNGCQGTNQFALVVNACTGISEQGLSHHLRVYPNPTGAHVSVETAYGTVSSIDVLDLTGRLILSNRDGNVKSSADLSGLAAGVYYLRVQTEHATEMVKIVKQ